MSSSYLCRLARSAMFGLVALAWLVDMSTYLPRRLKTSDLILLRKTGKLTQDNPSNLPRLMTFLDQICTTPEISANGTLMAHYT